MILPEPILRAKLKLELFLTYVKFVWAVRFGDPQEYFKEYEDKMKAWEELTKETIK